jgi:multidrug resistance efflux pump
MKVTFGSPKSAAPDRERGMRVPYAPAKRRMARWRWYLILVLVCAPLLFVFGQLLMSLVFVSAPGIIVLQRVPVNAALPAVVETVSVAPGDRVEPGQALALLRSADLEQRERVLQAEASARSSAEPLQTSEAVLKELQSGVRLAARVVDFQATHLKNVRFLFDQGAATLAELQLAHAQLNQAEIGLVQARTAVALRQGESSRLEAGDLENRARLQMIAAELEALAAQQTRLTSVSTVTGLVLEVPALPEQAVGQGDPLLVLGNLEALSVTAYLESKHIRYARAGQPATVHLANGRRLAAVVRERPQLATRIPDAITPALAGREYTLQLTIDLVDPLPPSERVDHLPVTVHFPFSF